MKLNIALLILSVAAFDIAFAAPMAVPSPNRSVEQQRLWDDAAEHSAKQRDLLEGAADDHQRQHALIVRAEEEYTRAEARGRRLDAILDTWERQQAQYQRYLDALNPSKKKR